jgi:hypothetical protein
VCEVVLTGSWLPQGRAPFPLPVQPLPFKLDDKGIPSRRECARHLWQLYELSDAGKVRGERPQTDVPCVESPASQSCAVRTLCAASSAYQALYDNAHGLRDAFVDYWRVVMRAFKGARGLLGIELFNEVRLLFEPCPLRCHLTNQRPLSPHPIPDLSPGQGTTSGTPRSSGPASRIGGTSSPSTTSSTTPCVR